MTRSGTTGPAVCWRPTVGPGRKLVYLGGERVVRVVERLLELVAERAEVLGPLRLHGEGRGVQVGERAERGAAVLGTQPHLAVCHAELQRPHVLQHQRVLALGAARRRLEAPAGAAAASASKSL